VHSRLFCVLEMSWLPDVHPYGHYREIEPHEVAGESRFATISDPPIH
jgi:hypothetical protein